LVLERSDLTNFDNYRINASALVENRQTLIPEASMKLPGRLRQLTRSAIGLRKSEGITPDALQALAAREPVLVLSVGMLSAGAIDDRLPGEQRGVSLAGLAAAVADVPKTRSIVTHCG
jgi:hypothetical protein